MIEKAAPGLLRPPKRPPGWIAPGPRPSPPEGVDWLPREGEDLCFLVGDYRILQRKDGHRFSSDDLVTAHFAARAALSRGRAPERICDLGCGIGTVLLVLAWRFSEARCTGIEAQEVSAQLARRSIRYNGLSGRCSVRLGDLRDPKAREGLALADLVTGTPPYLPEGTGTVSHKVQCGPCRFEHRGGIEEYCFAAAALLAPGAPFVACAAGFQRERVTQAADAAGLRLTAWRDVFPKPGKPPLFGVFSMAHAHLAGPFTEQEPLFLRGENGRFTADHDLLRHELGIPVER